MQFPYDRIDAQDCPCAKGYRARIRRFQRNHEFRSGGSVRQGRRAAVTSTNPPW
jgi:hypothetical protein